MKKIAIVMPAYNSEEYIEKSFLNISNGISLFPQYKFTLFPIDDASIDDTYQAFLHWGEKFKLEIRPFKNHQNLGNAVTLKKTYQSIIDTDHDAFIKTDSDADFNQATVLEKLVPYIEGDKELVVGVRWRIFTPEENPHEYAWREEELKILREVFGIMGLDPPSTGSQFYKKDLLKELLSWPVVQMYDRRWSLDMLLDLLAVKLGKKFEIINIEDGAYDNSRRPKDKVDDQYNCDIEIISLLTGEHPKELSKLYNR